MTIEHTNTHPKMTFRRALSIGRRRLREQGLRTSLLWLYGRGIPALTGVPILKYCRVLPQLYIGSQPNQRGFDHLVAEGITAIVNMRIEKDDRIFNLHGMEYLHLPVIDDTAPTVEQIKAGTYFIDQILAHSGNVYIHCGAGVGRAPTMAAAYMLWKGEPLARVIARITAVRPFIYITPPQAALLEQLAAEHDQTTG